MNTIVFFNNNKFANMCHDLIVRNTKPTQSYINDRVEIIANDQGNRTTPSYVAFGETERLIGDSAKNQASTNPENTVFDAKRLIGRKFSDQEVQQDLTHWPFKVIKTDGDKPVIQVEFKGESKQFTPEEISAMIL